MSWTFPEAFFLNLGPGRDFFMTQPVTRSGICIDRNHVRFEFHEI